MCLISIAPKGTNKYSEFFIKAIENGAVCNTSGMGYSYKKAGNDVEVFISKGFFNVKELLESIEQAKLTEDDVLVVHQRVATSGKTDNLNCHPFVISRHQEELLMIEGWVELPTLAHNGIFNSYAEKGSAYSDTYHFTREFMGNPQLLELFKENVEEFDIIFDRLNFMGWNKLAILFPDKGLVYNNGFITDNGYIFSNTGYCNSSLRNAGGVETIVEKTTFKAVVPKEDKAIEQSKQEEAKQLTLALATRSVSSGPIQKEEEPKGHLSSLYDGIRRWFSKDEDGKIALNISINDKNYDELILIAKNKFNIFEKGQMCEVVKFENSAKVFVRKQKDDKELANLTNIEIGLNFRIYSKEAHSKKYAEYKKMCKEIADPPKTFLKKLEKRISKCKKARIQIRPYGYFDRDAITEYKNQLLSGFNPSVVIENLEPSMN